MWLECKRMRLTYDAQCLWYMILNDISITSSDTAHCSTARKKFTCFHQNRIRNSKRHNFLVPRLLACLSHCQKNRENESDGVINHYRSYQSLRTTCKHIADVEYIDLCSYIPFKSKSSLSLFNLMSTFLLTPAFGLTSTQDSEQAFVQCSYREYNQGLFPAQGPLLTRTCILRIPSQHVRQPHHDTTRNHEEHHSTPPPNPAGRLRLCLARG
jgi:hypothetical protein